MRFLTCAVLLVSSVFADSKNQVFSDFTTPLPLRRGEILVLGIVGGWERWDAPQRAIRRTALEIRALHLPGVWMETVENHKLELAQELVTRAFDFDRSGALDPDERAAAQIIVYGQSLGGRATLQLCRWLNEQGIRVRLAVVVDSYGRDPYTVPPNVAEAANLYQRDFGPVKGAPEIAAEDPKRTRILGNWRYSYEGRDVPMPGEPGIRKWFMGSHLKMEYDPEPWRRVKDLLVAAATKDRALRRRPRDTNDPLSCSYSASACDQQGARRHPQSQGPRSSLWQPRIPVLASVDFPELRSLRIRNISPDRGTHR